MNSKQKLAVAELQKAFDRCHAAGLTGGVYDMVFYVWPAEQTEYVIEGPSRQFFERANEVGQSIDTAMSMDGGAGA